MCNLEKMMWKIIKDYIYLSIYLYIYIEREIERERKGERERERERERECGRDIFIVFYIYEECIYNFFSVDNVYTCFLFFFSDIKL